MAKRASYWLHSHVRLNLLKFFIPMALLLMVIGAGRAPNSDRRIDAFSMACKLREAGPVLQVGKLVLVGTLLVLEEPGRAVIAQRFQARFED